uniref:Uncharacterized protein n=1 Tax=Candidatus Kentrum sp. FW TaxID=2126338 RepID=A0A450T9N5_9GAMM|nr:MAG: hypothetical protein BECKFW1821C_GA0114237_10046 [Candidatus Kentron sp. FW]
MASENNTGKKRRQPVDYSGARQWAPLLRLCWSGDIVKDNTTRLWWAEDGTQVARIDHYGTVLGAEFSADGSRILTWTRNMAHLWGFGVDYDLPAEYLPLQVEVMTGTTMDYHGAVRTLSA